MTTKKPTPLSVVRAFAQQHPNFSGSVSVSTLTPKGKGGWGLTSRMVHAWASGGQAVMSAGSWHDGHSHCNGQCEVCGQVYFDKQLIVSYATHPEAGKTIEVGFMPYGCTHAEIAPLGHVLACAACRESHGLTLDGNSTHIVGDVYQVSLQHPTLTIFPYRLSDVLIDMCALYRDPQAMPTIQYIHYQPEVTS